MKILIKGKLTVIVVMIAFGQLFAQGKEPIVYRNNQAVIKYQDHLKHEFYWWPNSLISYPIFFDKNISLEKLTLVDATTGDQLPFQFSDVHISENGKIEATINFITNMPSGGSFNYILKPGIPENFETIQTIKSGSEFNIKTDKISIWIPASQNENNTHIPGPITGISQFGKERMGNSQFNFGQKTISRIESKIINEGPLFIDAELKYLFEDNSIYQANIRCIKGYDFIELKEKVTGFEDDENCSWTMDWNHFNPTHRQAPNHPYGRPKKDGYGFSRFDWETVGQNMLNSHHGITFAGDNGKVPFEVGIYGNWPAERVVTSSLFWDEEKMQSVGAFAQNFEFWNDNEYAIWHSSGKINIKFYFKDNKLSWYYPVFNGQRSSAISCYNHQNDIDYMNNLEKISSSSKTYPRAKMSQLSYNTFLQNRFSTIALNKLKDWDLEYPMSKKLAPVVFKSEDNSIEYLERRFLNGGYSCELAISGPCQNSGYSPVPARSFYENHAPQFNALLGEANAEQREKLSAMYLLHAYMAADEEYMPMKTMLSGHPNFLADIKGIPALAAFLFPEHSEAKNWGDLYEKYVDLNTRYHVRPNVNAWDSQGGRWTENIGTYTWAFLRPTVRSNFLLQDHWDGKNRFVNEQTQMLGRFILDCLSAPYDGESLNYYFNEEGKQDHHSWGVVTPDKAPARVHPPQGAHALRRMPPSVFWRFGKFMENYDPLLSENIRYNTRPEYDDMEAGDRKKEIYKFMYPSDPDRGTPSDFKSLKLTGYGIILRAAVGTKDELSVHLQQIDNGPNYRWGLAADGGCGTIYYYAAGKSYSHNGKEDIGDRRLQDTDMITNFGVFKDGTFKTIGKADLTSPLYDFSFGQFAEIVSSKNQAYSWPQYKSRSVMLVGSDYFMIYDDVFNQNMATRFSWFTHPNEDLPEINIVKGGGAGYTASRKKPSMSKHSGPETNGIWFDGTGDFLTFVSHKKGFTQTITDYGCIVSCPDGLVDFIFRNDETIKVSDNNFIFEGTAGLIRQRKEHEEWALFHGAKIGNEEIVISSSNNNAGISTIFHSSKKLSGEYYSYEPTEIAYRWNGAIPQGIKFFLDGIQRNFSINNNEIKINFPEGKHIWTITTSNPSLSRPSINYTINKNHKVEVSGSLVSGANKYLLEYSLNGTSDWKTYGENKTPKYQIKSFGTKGKAYVRITAINDEFESKPSVVYPIYFTSDKPHFPDGLKLKLSPNENKLTWGKVLGCNEYKLYRKENGSSAIKMIYNGSGNSFVDESISGSTIYEYAISATNGNGESKMSHFVTSDPHSWLNFDPVQGEPFRRSNSHWRRLDNFENEVDIYYPQ